eukprot:scaffold2299_cov131-Cylindrotheca_fusiformis.AAC.24
MAALGRIRLSSSWSSHRCWYPFTTSSSRIRRCLSIGTEDSYWSSLGPERHQDLHPWSLDELISVATEGNRQVGLQTLVRDITRRLDRQNKVLQSLEQILHDEEPTTKATATAAAEKGDDDLLDSAFKTLRDLKHLHKDTHRICSRLLPAMEEQQKDGEGRFNTLLYQHTRKILGETHTRHALTLENLAEMAVHVRPLLQNPKHWNDTMMHYLQSKIGLQLLADHGSNIAKAESSNNNKEAKRRRNKNKLGIVSLNTPVPKVIDQARTEAKHLCEAHYLTSPPVIALNRDDDFNDADVETEVESATTTTTTVTCVRPWLQFALVELLKNSMAITVQRKLAETDGDAPKHYYEYEEDGEFQLNPIYFQVDETETEVLIRIIDQGGGTNQRSLFRFCQTEKVWDRMDDQQTYAMTRSPLQGLGVGLCMSRLYMQHFGGNLELANHGPTVVQQVNQDGVCSMIELKQGMTATITIPKDTGLLERLPKEISSADTMDFSTGQS